MINEGKIVEEKETGRVEAFSDGVFAIAITLLILEIKVPRLPDDSSSLDLVYALIQLWPSFFAFFGSFVAILIMWINHHGYFNMIRTIDSKFIYANGFLLLLVTFVPFPTAVLAQYVNTQGRNVAAAFYCGTYLVINMAYNLLWYTSAANRKLIKKEVPNSLLRKIRNAYLAGFPLYLIATILSFVYAYAGLVLCSALWIFWALMSYKPSIESKNIGKGSEQ